MPIHGVVQRYADGDVIVREGEATREMYIIQRGRVEVTKALGGKSVVLATLERGDFFGEMSLLESQPRAATVRAKGDAELVVIEPGGLLLKIRRDPTFAFEMLQHMSHRIRDLDEQLLNVLRDAKVATPDAQAMRMSALTRPYLPPEAAEAAP